MAESTTDTGDDIPRAAQLVRSYGRGRKKSLGQHFLVDEHVLSDIAAEVGAARGEEVLEIGPGPGTLTQALLRAGAKVRAVEKDDYAAEFLRSQLAPIAALDVDHADVLETELPAREMPWRVVGNLPYNVGTEIFFWLFRQRTRIRSQVLMFQREVGERFCAATRTKAYGILSVVAQTFYEVRLVDVVPPEYFRPPPKVESAVVSFIPRAIPPMEESREELFRRVVKAAFRQRRKTLPNSMGGALGGIGKDEVRGLLAELGVAANARAEELSPEQFVSMTRALERRDGG